MLYPDVAHSCSAQCREVGTAVQCLSDVTCQGPDVCAFAAYHPDVCLHGFGVKCQQFYFVDAQRLGFELYLFSLSGQFVGTVAVDFAGRVGWWHLFDFADKSL